MKPVKPMKHAIRKKRLLALAHAVRNSKTYDQTRYVHNENIPSVYSPTNSENKCGAPACIAGHQAFLSLRRHETLDHDENIVNARTGEYIETPFDRAKETLGLNGAQAFALFAGNSRNWPSPWKEAFKTAKYDSVLQAIIAADLLTNLALDEALLTELMSVGGQP